MNRKHFITTLAPLALSATTVSAFAQQKKITTNPKNTQPVIPPYLKPGDTIGITCPAGSLLNTELAPAQKKLEEWGYNVLVGSTVGTKYGTFAATDTERAADFNAMLTNPKVKAILCGRGGYGCNRIIDMLQLTQLTKTPKWVIGFSDVTLLHTHINTQLGMASLHSKMCNSFITDYTKAEPAQIESIESINQCLTGQPVCYTNATHNNNRLGSAKAILVGGNLSIICSAIGTKSALNTAGKILFLEDVSEYLYNLDRMLRTLHRSGMLAGLKGLIIGGFKHKPTEKPEEEFAETIIDIVTNLTKNYNYPICFAFNVGHQRANYALQCGVVHTLAVASTSVTLSN